MAIAEYVTRTELRSELGEMEKRLESRIYTVKGEIIGRIETSEKRVMQAMLDILNRLSNG